MFRLIKNFCRFSVMVQVFAACFLLCTPCQVSFAEQPKKMEELPSILAKVNGTIITKYDLEQFMILLMQTEKIRFDTLQRQKELLNDMVDIALIEEFSKNQNLTIETDSVFKAFENIAAQNRMTAEEFEQTLEKSDIDKDVFLKRLRQQMIVSNFRNAFIIPQVKVGKADIRANRNRIIKKIVDSKKMIKEVSLSEIVVYKEIVGETEFERLSKELPNYLMHEDFSKLATKYSNNPSRENNGKVGWISYGDLSPLYQNIIKTSSSSQQEFEIYTSDIAIVVLKIDDINYQTDIDPKGISDEKIEEILKVERADEEMEKFMVKLRKNAFIETSFTKPY